MNVKIFLIRVCVLFIGCLAGSCDRKDLNDLYRMAAENELMVKRLEESAKDMTEEIRNLHNLTLALQKRLYVTGPVRRTEEGYSFTFGNSENSDSIRVNIKNGRTPLVEVSPETKTWWIDGVDTGVNAEGKDGQPAKTPQLRIGTNLCWEYSTDGNTWIETSVKATGADGTPGRDAQVGINGAGNWTIGGVEVQPPVRAWGKDGEDAVAPIIDIDKTVEPYEWKISEDGGKTWVRTGVKAQGKDGKPGEAAPGNPYIKQITVEGDVITFKFSEKIPGTDTDIQRVTIKRLTEPLSLKVNTADLEYLHSQYWLLLGVNETRTVRYTLTGTATHVEAVNLPEFVKASVNMARQEVTFTSSKDTEYGGQTSNFLQLMATNAEGEHALSIVRVSRIIQLHVKYGNESPVWEGYTAGGNRVTSWFRFGYENYNIPEGTYYYYGYPESTGFDPWWTTNPHPGVMPYPTVVKPLTVKDIDGNTYPVATGGTSYWMTENLKVTRYNDGTPIDGISDRASWKNSKNGAYCYYNDDKSQVDKYGLLYNARAVQSGKLCPKGWHVATDEEWTGIETWLENNNGIHFGTTTGWRGSSAGKRLKWMTGWTGYTRPSGSFQSMFEFLPGGMRDAEGYYSGIGTKGYWWTSEQDGGMNIFRGLASEKSGVYRNYDIKNNAGMSVRCVRGE